MRIDGVGRVCQIVCGANHVLALDSDGTIWSWGCNEQNQLGRRISTRLGSDAMTPGRIGIRGVKYVASGDYHSFAIDNANNVWAWGLNSFGQAGYPKTAGANAALTPYPMKIRKLSRQGILHLEGGAHHSVALNQNGECFVWGRMDSGQLGMQFTNAQLADPKIIRRDGHGRARICLQPTLLKGVDKLWYVACGSEHTIFSSHNGAPYASGSNPQRQLGLGHMNDVHVATRIQGAEIGSHRFGWVGAGGQFSMIAKPSPQPPINEVAGQYLFTWEL